MPQGNKISYHLTTEKTKNLHVLRFEPPLRSDDWIKLTRLLGDIAARKAGERINKDGSQSIGIVTSSLIGEEPGHKDAIFEDLARVGIPNYMGNIATVNGNAVRLPGDSDESFVSDNTSLY